MFGQVAGAHSRALYMNLDSCSCFATTSMLHPAGELGVRVKGCAPGEPAACAAPRGVLDSVTRKVLPEVRGPGRAHLRRCPVARTSRSRGAILGSASATRSLSLTSKSRSAIRRSANPREPIREFYELPRTKCKVVAQGPPPWRAGSALRPQLVPVISSRRRTPVTGL